MNDIDRYLEEKRQQRIDEQNQWLQMAADKINDNELIYFMMGLFVSYRFKIEPKWNGEPEDCVWAIVDNYINNINDKSFTEYLYSDDSPTIKKMSELKRIFPEFTKIYDDNAGFPTETINANLEILKLANKLYDLDLKPDDDIEPEYFFALSFDFNSFVPINIDEAKKLMEEKRVLMKYGHSTENIDEKLKDFGLTEEQLEVL